MTSFYTKDGKHRPITAAHPQKFKAHVREGNFFTDMVEMEENNTLDPNMDPVAAEESGEYVRPNNPQQQAEEEQVAEVARADVE